MTARSRFPRRSGTNSVSAAPGSRHRGAGKRSNAMLRWGHVNLDAGELRLPDSKTGGRAVPLAPSAVRLLTAPAPRPGQSVGDRGP